MEFKQSTPRRAFLGTIATGAAALGLTSLLPATKLAAAIPLIPEDVTEADKWFGKVKGKHRIVFDATNHHDSFPLAWTRVWLSTNNDTGTPDGDLSAVVILRHAAIPLAMKDELWAKYKLGEVFKIDDGATKAPAVRNIYWEPKPGELHFPDMSVDQLQKRGAMFCVCEMAITVYSNILGGQLKMDPKEIKKEWIAGIHPAIQVVPSGVWAVTRAQEHGCAYCFAG